MGSPRGRIRGIHSSERSRPGWGVWETQVWMGAVREMGRNQEGVCYQVSFYGGLMLWGFGKPAGTSHILHRGDRPGHLIYQLPSGRAWELPGWGGVGPSSTPPAHTACGQSRWGGVDGSRWRSTSRTETQEQNKRGGDPLPTASASTPVRNSQLQPPMC